MTQMFIKKYQYNAIKKYLSSLNNTFRTCIDSHMIEIQKSYIQENILGLFSELSEDNKILLDISSIKESLHIEKYLDELQEYVYGMPDITNAQISKVFKKEKKLKLPSPDIKDSKHVYLGWIDESLKKLFVIYNLDGKFVGMSCRIPNFTSNNTHMCTLCNHVGNEKEVAFVSPICKTSNDDYRSIGFDICLDSYQCNERITSTTNLEKLLKQVNNIK